MSLNFPLRCSLPVALLPTIHGGAAPSPEPLRPAFSSFTTHPFWRALLFTFSITVLR